MKIIGFALLCIANAIMAHHGLTFMTWEWWAIMVCMTGWSVLSDD
jgi:hypothetical protein